MDYDFKTNTDSLRIPVEAYKPIQRCRYCQSVFIDELVCESCGRSMLYHPVGDPFGPKSFYGIKQRYVESFHAFNRFFPQFENHQSAPARSYVRNLSKRFSDLISAFNTPEMIASKDRKLFYVESIELIDELLRYKTHPQIIFSLLEENDNSLVGQELLLYLQNHASDIKPEKKWNENFLEYRLWGCLRTEYFFKVVIISATVVTMAVKYKEIISSQFGR